MTKLIFSLILVLSVYTSKANTADDIIVGVYSKMNNYKIYTGTGFFVSGNEILTCYHVIKNSKEITVNYKNGLYKAKIKSIAAEYDLALLQIESKKDVHPLKFKYDFINMKIEDNLKMPGYANGLPNQTIQGKLTKVDYVNSKSIQDKGKPIFSNKIDLITIDCLTYGGMSGSPVICNDQIIGIISGSLNTGGSLTWAIPINYYSKLQPVTVPFTWSGNSLINTEFESSLRNTYEYTDAKMEELSRLIDLSDSMLLLYEVYKNHNLVPTFQEVNKTIEYANDFVKKPSPESLDIFVAQSKKNQQYSVNTQMVYEKFSGLLQRFTGQCQGLINQYEPEIKKIENNTDGSVSEEKKKYILAIENAKTAYKSKEKPIISHLNKQIESGSRFNTHLVNNTACIKNNVSPLSRYEDISACIQKHFLPSMFVFKDYLESAGNPTVIADIGEYTKGMTNTLELMIFLKKDQE